MDAKDNDYNSDVDDDLNPFRKHNKPAKDREPKKKFWKYKFAKQSVLTGIWICMGLMIGIVGPTLPDMKVLMGLNYEELARAMTGISIGALCGCITGGIIYERFYRFSDFLTGASTVVAGICISIVPLMRDIISLFVVCIFIGLTLGLSNAGGNAMVLHIWGKKSGQPMYSLHFGFGLGGMIAPQIARPFLSYHWPGNDKCNDPNSPSCIEEGNFTNITTIKSTDIHQDGRTHDHASTLFIPFLIIGIINLLCAIAMLAIFFMGPPIGFPKRKSAKKTKELFSPKNCAAGAPCYGVTILILLFLFYFTTVGGETIYGKYIYAFVVESDINLSEGQAATLASLFWIGHVIGRGSSAFISKFIPVTYMIFADICLLVLVTIVLAVIVDPMALWICTPLFGCLASPLFPGGMLWSNKILKVNSMTVMICLVGTSLGALTYTYLTGYFFEYHGPRSLMYIEVFHSCFLLAVFCFMEIIGRQYLKKVKTDREVEDFLNNSEKEIAKKEKF